MEKYSAIIDGSILKKVICKLIDRGASFSYEPLPDDKHEISVKEEIGDWLDKTISKLNP